MTTTTRYQQGYQQALDDLAEALEAGGTDAVFVWIYDNAESAVTRHIVKHLTDRAG